MPITLTQKKQLIDQIANNLTGDFIRTDKADGLDIDRSGTMRCGTKTYMGNVYPIFVATNDIKIIFNIDNQELFTIKECNCIKCGRYRYVNGKQNYYRKIIETNIVNLVITKIPNTNDQITLICIGSDWAGLSVILANLYKIGYINFSIINIEQSQDKYNRNMAQLEQINNIACLQFWKELFSNASIQCITIGVDTKNTNLSIFIERFITTPKLIIFAEDLGDIDDRILIHNNCINTIVDAIKKIKTEKTLASDHKIFVVQFDGTIIENSIVPSSKKSTNRNSFLGLRKGFLL
ncbi:MAG: hypothetical protein ABSA84_00270 [Gammaproteobacteria bacterium]|jgi:hypothetical protein